MLLSILLLAQAVGSPPPASASPAGILSMDDYPREALRKNQQGDVQVKVGVSADGHPTGCTVIHSSGYPALDAQTCKVIMARAGFSPALDAAGHPVPSTFTAPMIHWRIQ